MSELTNCSRFAFVNELGQAADVYLEPWGWSYTVEPQSKLEVLAFTDRPGTWFTLITREDEVRIHIEGSQQRTSLSCEVYLDGVRIAEIPIRS